MGGAGRGGGDGGGGGVLRECRRSKDVPARSMPGSKFPGFPQHLGAARPATLTGFSAGPPAAHCAAQWGMPPAPEVASSRAPASSLLMCIDLRQSLCTCHQAE